jgi:hypothetical protein
VIENQLTSDDDQRVRQLSLSDASGLFRKGVLSYQRLGKSRAETFTFRYPAVIVLAAAVPDCPRYAASASLVRAIQQDGIVGFEQHYHA